MGSCPPGRVRPGDASLNRRHSFSSSTVFPGNYCLGRSVPKLGGWAPAWDVDSGTGNGTALGAFLSGFGYSKGGAEIGRFWDVSLGGEGGSCDGPPETSGFSPYGVGRNTRPPPPGPHPGSPPSRGGI